MICMFMLMGFSRLTIFQNLSMLWLWGSKASWNLRLLWRETLCFSQISNSNLRLMLIFCLIQLVASALSTLILEM